MINVHEIEKAVSEYRTQVAPTPAKQTSGIAFEAFSPADTEQEAKTQDTRRINVLNELKYEPFEFAFERTIGNNDNVYSNLVIIQHPSVLVFLRCV